MGIKRNDGRHGTNRACALNDSLHDQLMAHMQAVKHSERQYGGSLNLCVVSAVE
jgi:hypothetical protein